jgi:exopolyphosphatase/guanosine-5'-triphosphate,3'-diphosphate pyrophosphatase
VSPGKLEDAATVAGRYARLAARLDADAVAAVVTAPGRQGRASTELVAALGKGVGSPVRVLTAEEEGRFAFLGATARLEPDGGIVAVCDVGGGSTELVVGTVLLGPAWVRSADIGSLRLTRVCLNADRAGTKAVDRARQIVERELEEFAAPRADVALAVGGSARAAAKIAGRRLGREELEDVITMASRTPPAKLARAFGFDAARAETVLAGAIILSAVAERLDAPLRLGQGGLREGIALTLARASEERAA